MDRPISLDEASDRFSTLVEDVQRGDTFVVMSAGKAVAKLSPVGAEPVEKKLQSQAERVRIATEWLKTQPIITTGPWTRDELYER